MTLDNSAILSFNVRNLITVTVIVAVGFFFIHIFQWAMGNAIALAQNASFSGSEDLSPGAGDATVTVSL